MYDRPRCLKRNCESFKERTGFNQGFTYYGKNPKGSIENSKILTSELENSNQTSSEAFMNSWLWL